MLRPSVPQIDSIQLQLLFCCLSGKWTTQQQHAIADVAAQISSWETFVALTQRHRLIPQVQWALEHCHAATPPDVRAQLKSQSERCLFQNMLLQAELSRISRAFADAGIPLVALKGPVVEQQVYARGQRRQYRDLDVLIQPNSFAESCALLQTLGYGGQVVQAAKNSAAQTRRLINSYKHVHAERNMGNTRLIVELHWRLGGTPRMFAQCEHEIWQRPGTVAIGNVDVRTLPKRESLIFLACHGGRHRWKRLSWLCDFARAAEQTSADAWPEILSYASHLSLRPYLDLGLLMLDERVPHCQLPEAIRTQVRQTKGLGRAMASSRHAIVSEEMFYENQPFSSMRWYFELDHCFSDRLHALASTLAPADDDIIQHGWWQANLSRLRHLWHRSLGVVFERNVDRNARNTARHGAVESEQNQRSAA